MKNRIIASLDYTYSSGKLLAFIFGVIGLLGIFSLVIVASINNFNFSDIFINPLKEDVLPYFIPSIASVLTLLIAISGLSVNFYKRNKIHRLLKNGIHKKATIISSFQDFSVTNNKVPRRIIKFKAEDGQEFTFKSFDYGLVPQLTENKVIPIIHNKKGDVFPDPDFFSEKIDNFSPAEKKSIENQFAEKCIVSGDEHLKNNNLDGALLAFEMAYDKVQSKKVIQKLIEVYSKKGNDDKVKQFKHKLKSFI